MAKWTDEEINTVATIANRGVDDKTIATTLNRSLAAVEQRRQKLRRAGIVIVDIDRLSAMRETRQRNKLYEQQSNNKEQKV